MLKTYNTFQFLGLLLREQGQGHGLDMEERQVQGALLFLLVSRRYREAK